MHLLLKRIAEGIDYDAFQPESLYVSPQLMLRESCAPPHPAAARRNAGGVAAGVRKE